MSGSRVRLCDRDGYFIDEIKAKTTRTWERNNWGEATFNFPYNDPKWKESTFRWGNLLYITQDGLPDWAGVIDKRRVWGKTECEINAYSAEYLFNLRTLVTPLDQDSVNLGITAPSGRIFMALVDRANLKEDTLIDPYEVWGSGPTLTLEGAYIKISDALTSLLAKSGCDYAVIPYIDTDQRLKFYGNWYEHRVAFCNTVLREGYNTEVRSQNLLEYPPTVNSVLAYGNLSPVLEQWTKPAEDPVSIALYRLRQDCVGIPANHIADVEAAAVSAIAAGGQQRIFDMVVQNKTNEFQDMNIGNVLNTQFVNYGFGSRAQVQIVRMEYTDGADKINLTFKEYTG